MIHVVRITGESYDLESGTEIPKALVLSNGVREFSLHVDDDTVQAVVEMMAEAQAHRNHKTISKTSQVKVPGNGSPPEPSAADLVRPAHREELEGLVEGFEPAAPAMASVIDLPEDEPDEEEGYEPGEEYSDPATGVGSL